MNSRWVYGLYWLGALSILAYFGVRTYWLFTHSFARPVDAVISKPNLPLPSRSVDTGRIWEFHLFGEVIDSPAAKSKPNLQAARPSTRDYRIAGLAQARQPERSSVLFELKPGDMAFFRIDDSIEPGVKVARIRSDSVYLDVNGRLERLEVPAAKERLLIPASSPQGLISGSDDYDWGWLDQWDTLADAAVADKLGLVRREGQWVISRQCPFLSARQIRGGFVVMAVNGVALRAGDIKRAFEPLREGEDLYILLQTPRKRFSVRWKR